MTTEEEQETVTTRVRVVFENGEILNKSQRSDGLKQSWILLKPQQLHTISDLSSYLLHIFHLHQSCSNGLLLSMDGFVLPPFESTCILKDKDIISVKKKGSTLSDAIEGGDTVEQLQITGKQTVQSGVPLLANKEFDNEGVDYQSESEEDEEEQPEDTLPVKNSSGSKAVSKKRKCPKKLQSSKKKKCRLVVPDGVENDVHTENIESNQNNGVVHRKSLCKKEKRSDSKRKPYMDSTSEIAEGSNVTDETKLGVKSDQLVENGEGIKDVSHVPEGTKKVPSRSARRKYAKRKWLKELKKAEKKDDSCHPEGLLNVKQERAKTKKKEVVSRPKGLLHWKKLPDIDPQNDMIEDEQPNRNSDVEDDVIPVVVRPGHIRFEPPGKEQAVQQTPVSVETFQWTGSTNKNKSRKCRKEKFSSARGNDYKKDLNKLYTEALATEKEMQIDFPIDFDNLPPLTTVAEEGDVIAYRLIELSSTWTPELSSFRVGKILWCDPRSTNIVLMPISEKKDKDANSEIQPDNSLHMEDGKLEIDFKLLIDVRVVKHGDSVPAKPIAGKQTQASNPENGEVNPWERLENGEVNPWERIGEVAYTKKARLYGENGYYRIRK